VLVVAFKLIDLHHIREILKSSGAESLVLLSTFFGILFFQIEFAIYTGVLLSLAIYLTRTAHPHITVLAPDPADPRRRLAEVQAGGLAQCPQLKIIRINGTLFFGAANHVSEVIEALDAEDPKNMLIVGHGINFIDVSGAMLLTQEAQRRTTMGRRLFLCRINRDVMHFLENGEFIKGIGRDGIFSTEYDAIAQIYRLLDAEVCRICTARIFRECRSIPQPNGAGARDSSTAAQP
jgi:sulfate permease, SulP family